MRCSPVKLKLGAWTQCYGRSLSLFADNAVYLTHSLHSYLIAGNSGFRYIGSLQGGRVCLDGSWVFSSRVLYLSVFTAPSRCLRAAPAAAQRSSWRGMPSSTDRQNSTDHQKSNLCQDISTKRTATRSSRTPSLHVDRRIRSRVSVGIMTGSASLALATQTLLLTRWPWSPDERAPTRGVLRPL